MRNFFEKLLPQLSLQNYDHIDIDDVVFNTYRRMMMSLKIQADALPKGQYAEIGFDHFQADPLGELARVYSELNLGEFSEDSTQFEAYLESVKAYKKNAFELPEALIAKIDENWSDLYSDWGYASKA